MEKVVDNLREFKLKVEVEGVTILDIVYYGKINLSKNDADIKNERQENLYLVKKQVDGKNIFEFYTDKGVIATIGEDGQIKINDSYKHLINEKEFLLQMQKVSPISLQKLEKIEQQKNEKDQVKEDKEEKISEEPLGNKYNENAKDIRIDMTKKITETKTFAQLVPEVKEKGIVDVRVRRVNGTKFEFIGINKDGMEIPLESLEQTEGTNPSKDIIEVNKDGSQVEKNQTMTMLKLTNGTNAQRQDEGFTVDLGQYGEPEVQYYRRSRETNEYTSIPVNLKNTNQKRTELEVREYIEKKRNSEIQEDIERAEDRIEYNENEETTLSNIDDDLTNDEITDDAEIQIRKAAARCKMDVEDFKEELEKADGETLEEKIENAEEEINEQFRGNTERRR